MLSLFFWREPLSGPNLIVAFFGFVGAADFLRLPNLKSRQSIFTPLRFLFDPSLRWFLFYGIILALLYFSGLTEKLNSNVLRTWGLLAPLAFWGGQLAAMHWGLHRIPPRRAVVVGLTDLGIKLGHHLNEDPRMCADFVGFFEYRGNERLPAEFLPSILGQAVHLPEYIVNNQIDIVYITLPMARHPRVLRLLEVLRDSTVSIYFVPDFFVFNLIQARFDRVHGIPVVSLRESPLYGLNKVSKRSCDLALSLVAVLILSPLLLAAAIGVRITSQRPVLFKQRRYGLEGSP